MSENTYNNYKNAGAVHILAVSGLHAGIILFILEFMLSPVKLLPKGKNLKLIIVVLLLWSYAFIAELSPSIVRAVTMFSFVANALYLLTAQPVPSTLLRYPCCSFCW
ncbi:ComEC/Rec2 family competence protein [Flagellimonas lutimaris]|uniref:ComEC/Rec2 family competence protein n=1 Tax=Flagellimonas lutimaris TaxID=475082 RepID=UPI001FE3E925|nr:ComEC/Rec2 family competence protein [Allomuricauda lutimaris]